MATSGAEILYVYTHYLEDIVHVFYEEAVPCSRYPTVGPTEYSSSSVVCVVHDWRDFYPSHTRLNASRFHFFRRRSHDTENSRFEADSCLFCNINKLRFCRHARTSTIEKGSIAASHLPYKAKARTYNIKTLPRLSKQQISPH